MKQSKETVSPLAEQSAPLQLHYFHIRGVGQPVRHLLYHLGVPFEEVVHEREEVEVGFDIGLPFLQDGDSRVHEPVAIMHYLCLKYERRALTGLTPQSIVDAVEVLIKYSTQRKRIMAILFEAFSALPSTPAHAQPAFVHNHLRRLTSECRFMEFCLRQLARGKEWVLEELTVVDFLFYELCFYICGFLEALIDPSSPYALLPAYMRRFELLPFYDRHRSAIEQRPLFHQFASPEINAIIQQTWKGPRGPELLRKSPCTDPPA